MLKENESEKISGGYLSDEEVKKFFPKSKFKDLIKSQYTAAVCKKCGKEFARFSGMLCMAMNGVKGIKYSIGQDYCKKCADEEIKRRHLDVIK